MANNVTYEDLLYELQDSNDIPVVADLLPDTSQIYDIDLNKRTVNIPQFLSVQYDHNAEVIYFKCPRWFEGVDLAQTTCIIQYINADGDSGVYCVPFYDLTYFEQDENGITVPMILLPWSLGGLATVAAGTISFNIRFYKINATTKKFIFNLSTQKVSGTIIHGIDLEDDELDQYKADATDLQMLFQNLRQQSGNNITYWHDV